MGSLQETTWGVIGGSLHAMGAVLFGSLGVLGAIIGPPW